MVIIWLMMVNNDLVGGWALPLWKKWVSQFSWDDDIHNMMGQIWKNNPNVPNHQPGSTIMTLGQPWEV